MLQRDHAGLVLTGASPKAATAYRRALSLYHRMGGDPLALLEDAIADSPAFIMAHVLKANLMLVGTNPEAMMGGIGALDAAKALPGTDRERGHVAALANVATGEFRDAGHILEDISIAYPRDTHALQAGQLMDFLLGDSRMLRDRIARALPHWSPAIPDYHAVLAMLAFGLEECGFYGRAETAGRRALELEPRDAWAQHAVAHVIEMQDRRADGVAFMRRESIGWQEDSYFAVHNWWHLALFHLGLGETDEVLRLYDGPIYGEASTMEFDRLDAASMLWRLKLLGVEVGDRWNRLADIYEQSVLGMSAFSDAHAVMAFVGAGRRDGVKAVLAAQELALAGPGDNAVMVREVGLPLIQAIVAFDAGAHATATDRLRGIRNRANRFGGSHAQRDLIDLTLIAAARRGRDHGLEKALLAERANAKPLSIGDEVLLDRAA